LPAARARIFSVMVMPMPWSSILRGFPRDSRVHQREACILPLLTKIKEMIIGLVHNHRAA
jgi:hypothetical protein